MPDQSESANGREDQPKEEAAGPVGDSTSASPVIEELIASFRDANEESLAIARESIRASSMIDPIVRALETTKQAARISGLFDKQASLSQIIGAAVNPFPSGIETLMSRLNETDEAYKIISESIRPSQHVIDIARSFSTAIPELPTIGPTQSLLDSINKVLLANTLDTSVARMLAEDSVHSALRNFADGWRKPIWDDIARASEALEQLQLGITASPILEFGSFERFNAVRLFRSTAPPEDALEEADSGVIELVRTEILDSFESALESVEPKLVPMWRGAKDAAKSSSADRVRHVAVSLREMTTHLLHILAPDDEIRSWSTRAEDFDQGRPTRSGRMRFILRRYGHEVEAFFELDVKSAVRWIDIINGQTHALESFQTDGAIEALITRFEGIALFLIRGARGFE